MLVSPAAAQPEVDAAHVASSPDGRRSPSITVGAGAVLTLFLPYEFPGPWLSASVAWPIREHLELVASADTGVIVAAGSTRFLGGLGGGVRVSPWWRIWGQLGLGMTGYVERIGLVLPDREVRATDVGVALTGDVSIGFRVTRRWEIVVGYDHQLLWTGPEKMEIGTETLPHIGTGMLSIGRQL